MQRYQVVYKPYPADALANIVSGGALISPRQPMENRAANLSHLSRPNPMKSSLNDSLIIMDPYPQGVHRKQQQSPPYSTVSSKPRGDNQFIKKDNNSTAIRSNVNEDSPLKFCSQYLKERLQRTTQAQETPKIERKTIIENIAGELHQSRELSPVTNIKFDSYHDGAVTSQKEKELRTASPQLRITKLELLDKIKEIHGLKEELIRYQTLQEKDFERMVTEIRRETKEIISDLTLRHKKEQRSLQESVQRLEEEVSILKKENIYISEREKNKEKQLREKENLLQSMSSEKSKLDRNLTQHEIKILELEKGYENERRKRENLEKENDSLTEKNRTLKSNLEKASYEKDSLNSKLQEKIRKENDSKDRIAKLEKDCERLSKILNEMESYTSQKEKEFTQQKSKTDSFTSEREALFNKIEDLNCLLKKANEEKAHLINDIENLTRDNHKWNQENLRVRAEFEENARHLEKIKVLLQESQDEQEKLHIDIDLLSDQMQSLSDQETASRILMQKEIMRLKEIQLNSETQIQKLMAKETELYATVIAKDQVIKDLDQLVRKQKDTLIAQETDRKNRESNELNLSDSLDRKSVEYVQIFKEHQVVSDEYNKLKGKYEELLKSNSNLNEILTRSQTLIVNQESKISELSTKNLENDDLKEDLTTIARQKKHLEEKNNRLIEDLKESTSLISEKNTEIEELKALGIKNDEHINLLNNKIDKKRISKAELKKAFEAQISENLKLREDCKRLKGHKTQVDGEVTSETPLRD